MGSISRTARVRAFFVLLACAMVLWGATSHATIFTVNNLDDNLDTSPGDGVCDVGNGTCSFRAAVQEANALAGFDRLELIAGTHTLTRFDTFGLIKPSLNGDMEIVGAGIGQTIIFSDTMAQTGMIDVLSQPLQTTISNLTIDNQTGLVTLIYSGFGHNIVNPIGLLLEDVELLANTTVPTLCCGASEVLDLANSGEVILRRVQIQAQRVSANGFLINARTPGGVVIEDSILDGGNQYRIALLQNLVNNSYPITVRGTTFRNFGGPAGLFGAADAVIYMRPFNVSGQTIIESSTFESSYQALNIVNSGATATVTISDTLFNGMSSTAVRASGPATVTMDNSTISGGTSGVVIVAPAAGGGVVDMTLNNSTLTGATFNASITAGQGTLTAQNSIIANGVSGDCSGTLTSAGHNLIEGTCTVAGDTTGNITGQDPQLDTLADNGGPTLTHALLAGSPAVDSGSDVLCLATDQRGFSRPADGDGNMTATCDMGAFEKDAILVSNPPDAMDDDFSGLEDANLNMSVLSNDTDGDGTIDPGTVNTDCGTCSQPTNGSLSFPGSGIISYSPSTDFFGQDSFVYEICDDLGGCDTATVTMTIDPVNDAPSFQTGPDQSFPGGTSGTQAIANWASGFDPGPLEGGQSLSDYMVTITSDASGILNTADVSNIGTLDLDLTGTTGTATLTAVVMDDGGTANSGQDTSVTQTFFVTVGTNANLRVLISQCSDRNAPDRDHNYVVRVFNRGPDSANGILLDFDLPMDSTFVTSLPGEPDCIESAGNMVCDIGTLVPFDTRTIQLQVNFDAMALGVLSGQGVISAVEPDLVLADNTTIIATEIIEGLGLADGFESCGSL